MAFQDAGPAEQCPDGDQDLFNCKEVRNEEVKIPSNSPFFKRGEHNFPSFL